MKTKILIIAIHILLSVAFLQAQVVRTINVTTAGTLNTLLGTEKTTITDLTLTGTINAADFTTIKQMTALKDLDMSAVNIDNGTIPTRAFQGKILDRIVLPVNLKTINDNAFTDMTVPSLDFSVCPDLAFINTDAFVNIKTENNILDFSTNSKLVNFGNLQQRSALSLFTGHVILPRNMTTLPSWTFTNFKGSFDIPNTIEVIGVRAFYKAKPQGEFRLPANLKIIEENAFTEMTVSSLDFSVCPDLAFINTDAFVNIKMEENVLDFSMNSKLVNFGNLQQRSALSLFTGHVILPRNMTTLPSWTFANFKGSFDIPNSIETIGTRAFNKAAPLGEFHLPTSLRIIGENAFTEMTVPSLDFSVCPNLEQIGIHAFVNVNLEKKELDFSNCTKLDRFLIYNEQGSFITFTGQVILPYNMKVIPANTFAYFKGSVRFPQGLEEIGKKAFFKSTLSDGIVLPSTLKIIRDNAFQDAVIPSIEFEGMDMNLSCP